ncbi:hypothetical protein FVEN_g6397 [Fusarium venenatum]|uniref:NmrA-like domain-containing protein n=1 Tax=Fusarium venenatum TaxID=56646 RepID=A0A2L2SV82_9HYPO|nr:uncharacterized protein FVRRES_04655 [Fusarium venenatum]KAG8355766.1 hypothetical protein FVEN_g6397 [Fusarium venenatum]KAH6991812.1 hypothetical protein EDB82DRAFT_122044 [Fusarium venenatum]CEI60219.1 unnamed protein product [Fusarium venenatum]
MTQIGIFPASGALGTSTYTHLLSQVPNDKVTLINRYPEKVPKKYTEKGTTVRQASYESSAEDLQTVFSGIDVLFLISYPSHVHQYRTKVHTKAIDAAVKAGAKHIFYSSLGFASIGEETTKAEVMGAHLDSEKHLKELAQKDNGFTFTSVREGLYSESFPIYTSFLDLKNPPSKVLIPHDGSGPGVSWVKRDELGEGTARLIASYVESPSSFGYINKIVTLTGTKSFTLAETIEILSRAAGKDFGIEEISVEEYINLPQIKEYFGTEEKATTWATAWEAIRAGETAGVTTTLKELLGREPEAFEKTIEEFVKN